ncbi:ABC transporter ATP-binding protein [Mechercharimyces sp. CAU 1602]|uniref:ATP-binding cassette domain-containing protein n=1 Tax=Mechercharimyces sp. CAU 1602 TaxID=2973933 RepID=UPI0021620236|nr:ABC transporter ATP-binding protein [Mechercharimyces sp. CAU 1602]MCS1352541.1 ABC transporter ATP-binding protein [Mechercharimyces sp. CAU 1602]
MITFNHVQKRYLNKTALHNINISIPTGKIIGVLGENGSGKSTLLKLIAGLAKPTKGTITVDKQLVTRTIAARIAFLTDKEMHYPMYTVEEMIHYYASQFPDFDTTKASKVATHLQIPMTRKVSSLSKGTQGRVKLMLTLARNAPYILMDEPLSGLDPMVRQSIIHGLLSFVNLEEQTVLLATHEVQEVEPILDMVLAIRAGEVLKLEEADQIRSQANMSITQWMHHTYTTHPTEVTS